MNAERRAALTSWTSTEIAFRLASDELFGAKDPELNRALEVELVSRVGIAAAMDAIETERAPLHEEHQEWALERWAAQWHAEHPAILG